MKGTGSGANGVLWSMRDLRVRVDCSGVSPIERIFKAASRIDNVWVSVDLCDSLWPASLAFVNRWDVSTCFGVEFESVRWV